MENPEIKNFLLVQNIITLGDIYLALDNFEQCEKSYLHCHSIICNMFGEKHPCVIEYTAKLVQCYTTSRQTDPTLI